AGVALVLAEDPVPPVVDDEERRVEVVLPRSGELGEAVHDPPVAGDREGLCPGGSRTERGRPGVAEGARADRVQEPARPGDREVRGCDVGEDRRVPGRHGARRQRGCDAAEQAELELAPLTLEAERDALTDGADPLRALALRTLRDALEQRRERRP